MEEEKEYRAKAFQVCLGGDDGTPDYCCPASSLSKAQFFYFATFLSLFCPFCIKNLLMFLPAHKQGSMKCHAGLLWEGKLCPCKVIQDLHIINAGNNNIFHEFKQNRNKKPCAIKRILVN